MATIWSEESWTGTYTYTRVKIEYSGTSATATLYYTRTNTYSGATSSGNATFTFGGVSTSFDVTFYGQQTDAYCTSVNFTISEDGGTYSGSSTGGYIGGSWSVDIPSQRVAPNTPTCTIASTEVTSVGITYGTSSYNNPSTGTTYLYGGTSSNPTTQIASKTATGNTTYTHTGRTGNTTYYYRARAYNSKLWSNFSTQRTVTTKAPVSNLTLNTANSDSLVINYSTPADGGVYDKTLEYSIDGSVWSTAATISGGSATTGAFIIPNLNANTEYTIQSRVSTTAGTTVNENLVASTIGPATPTCTLYASTVNSVAWQYGTTTFGGGTNGVVRLYSGTSSAPTTEVENKTTTGNSEYTLTGLTSNTRYYARARAEAEFDEVLVYSDYSAEINTVLPSEAPTVTALAVLQYETATTVSVRGAISVSADGGELDKTIQYKYKIGNNPETSWTNLQVISGGSATNLTVDISDVPVNTQFILWARSTTSGWTSDSSSKTITTSGEHAGPTGFDWTLNDNNSTLQTWLSGFSGYTNPIFVQGQSRVKIDIPSASAGTASDGASITHYEVNLPIDNTSLTIQHTSGDMSGMFSAGTPQNRSSDFPSNLVTVSAKVYDSLDTYTQVNKQALSLSYEDLTLQATGERLQNGGVLINYLGTYARLQDNSLNSGQDLNSLGTLQYRISDYQDNVLIDWTNISGTTLTNNENAPFLKDFSGTVTVASVPTINSYKIEIKASDHFTEQISEISMDVWQANQVIYPPDYEIELWDWKTNTFIADISYLVVGSLTIDWNLNDVEEVSFNLDLLRFEEKCQAMGINSTDLLAPYAHDIRIRRNGEYILGCQLVETTIQLTNNPPAKINVKGTGFLNLFKDQYILNEAWSGYTYAQIARKLVEAAQKPDCLIKNPTIDIDTSYWLANTGTLSYSSNAHSGDGCIAGSRSGTGWISYGSQMNVDSGESISLDLWVKGQSGRTCYVRERKYITQYSNQVLITQITLDGTWQHIQVSQYETFFENGYILVEMDRTDSSSMLYADDVYVYSVNDDASLCNLHVPLGVDTASSVQQNTRQVKYELQNVKDALIDLTQMEEDNFDFEFLPDRTFNVYARKGADKLDLDISYPGNMESMNITRSASNLANKIIAIGSGIGDERLQVEIPNNTSRNIYGTHEGVTTDSNISLKATLLEKAIGNLYDRKDPTNLPQIKIKDGSINPSNIETGDVVPVSVNGVDYIKSATGEYRVVEVRVEVGENAVEEMSLTVEQLPERPEKKMVRYIRESILGSSDNYSHHWIEVQALMLVGNEYINVALGKTVYSSKEFYSGEAGERAVDNDFSTYAGIMDTSANRRSITIDLGEEYPLDYVKVYHYYADGRTYYGSHLSVGTEIDSTTSTDDLDIVLWEYSDNDGWVETSDGHRSKWIQEDNVVYGGEES